MIFLTITFDIKDKEYFKMLKQYIMLNYSNTIKIDNKQYDYTISDKEKLNNKYIIINDTDFDIYKYQKASRICTQLMNKSNIKKTLYNDENYNSKIKIITVTSTVGGAGKTTLAEKICVLLANDNNKVLYISLNSSSILPGNFRDKEEVDISKLKYYIIKKEDTNISIEKCKSYDVDKDVFFIRSTYPSMDGFMSIELIKKLLEEIKQNSIYDFVVFDIPSCLTKTNIEIINQGSLNFLIKLNENTKEQIYIDYLKEKVTSKINVINRQQDIKEQLKDIVI